MAGPRKYTYAFTFIPIVDTDMSEDFKKSQSICEKLKNLFLEKTDSIYKVFTSVALGDNIIISIKDAIKDANYVLLFFAESSTKQDILLEHFTQDAFKRKSGDAKCIPIAFKAAHISALLGFINPLIFNEDWENDNKKWDRLLKCLTENLEQVEAVGPKVTSAEAVIPGPSSNTEGTTDGNTASIDIYADEQEEAENLNNNDMQVQPSWRRFLRQQMWNLFTGVVETVVSLVPLTIRRMFDNYFGGED